METNRRLASMRQIHAAIDHLYKSEFESAITLASAAEGILPKTEKPHLFQKIKKVAKALPADTPGATGINDFTNWTKHGTHETATISEQDAIEVVTRAISKFVLYMEQNPPKWKHFGNGQ
jgi:hypothetical protein